MIGSRTVTVVTSVGVRKDRCKFCKADILWATTTSEPGRPARSLPFDPPRPVVPLSVTRNDETGLVIETWSRDKLHFVTCKKAPPRKFRPGRGRVFA